MQVTVRAEIVLFNENVHAANIQGQSANRIQAISLCSIITQVSETTKIGKLKQCTCIKVYVKLSMQILCDDP